MKIRYLIVCGILGFVVFLGLGVWGTYADMVAAYQRIVVVRATIGGANLPVAPFVIWGIKYALFYVIAGSITGMICGGVGHLLVRPVGGGTGNSAASGGMRRSYLAGASLLAGFIIYVYLRMLTLHPALFDNSYRVDWFVGNPLCVMAVWAFGRGALAVIGVFLIRKYARGIGAFARSVFGAKAAARAGGAANGFGRRAGVYGLAAAVLAAAAGVGGFLYMRDTRGDRPSKNVGPNVIVIALDSTRADHLSWKGRAKPYPRSTSPNIDRFLDDSVWFDQAFTPMARTYPSWMSILTGCWPPTHGTRFDLMPKELLLPRVPTLAQALQSVGYRTAFFLDNTNFAWIEPALGFDEIVQPEPNVLDFYLSSIQPLAVLYYYFLNNSIGYLYEPGLRCNSAYRAIYREEFMNGEIARSLARMKGETKFFEAIHLCSIHVPFTLSYPQSTWFRPSGKPVPNRFGYRALIGQILDKKESGTTFSVTEAERVFQQEVNLYDALLRSADAAFGDVIDSIKREGLYDNSFIVFMGDHGEHLPEQQMKFRYRYRYSMHGCFMWGDQDTRVPLAIKFPKGQHAGRKVERLVRTIDLAPTLLEALGLPPLEKADGVSRMADVLGGSDDRERWTYGETGLTTSKVFIDGHLAYEAPSFPAMHEVDPKTLKLYKKLDLMPNLVTVKDRMLRTERWKAIAYPIVTLEGGLKHEFELFDMAVDRNCLNDLKTSEPAVMKDLGSILMRFIQADLKEFGSGPAIRFEQPDPVMTGSF